MITLNNFYLRPLEETDLDWLKNLRTSPYTWPYLGTFVLINSRRQQQWFANLINDSTREYLVFGKKEQRLGIARLTEIDWINRSVCVGGDIVPPQRGKGYGKLMFKLIFNLCFELWGMNRVWLLALASNEVAYSLYRKLGFQEEGRLKQAVFREGKFIDYILMAVLAEQYYSGKK